MFVDLTLGMPAKQICEVSIFRESLKMETPILSYSASSTTNKSKWPENIRMFDSIWQQKQNKTHNRLFFVTDNDWSRVNPGESSLLVT